MHLKRSAKMISLVLLAALPVDLAQAGQSTDQIDVSGELRLRSEYPYRVPAQAISGHALHLLRARLSVGARPVDRMDVAFELEASRNSGSSSSAGTTRLYQGYVRLRDLFHTPFSLRLGRMGLAIGNERIVGTPNWGNIGRAYDGAGIDLDLDRIRLTGFASRLSASPDLSRISDIYGTGGTFAYAERHAATVLFLFEDTRDSRPTTQGNPREDNTRFTIGAELNGRDGAFTYDVESYLQIGTRTSRLPGNLTHTEIRAHLVSLQFGMLMGRLPGVHLQGGYTLRSGDRNNSDNTVRTFESPSGRRHRFHGNMDIFPLVGSAAAYGLQDAFGSATVAITEASDLSVEGHQFSAAVDIPGIGDAYGKELDISLDTRLLPKARLQGGISFFSPEGVVRVLYERKTATWFFLSLTAGF